MRYNPPPNWPTPPPGWTPEPGWEPNPAWGPEPPGWPLWIADAEAADPSPQEPFYDSSPAYANPNPPQPPAPSYQPPSYGFAPGPTYYGAPVYGPTPRRRRTGALWAAGVGVLVVFVAVFAVLLLTTSGIVGPSDEEQIRETVSAMESAYNEADPTTFRGLICDAKRSDFSEDADDMRQTLEFGGEITLDVDTVYVNGERATAEVSGEIFAEGFEETWRFVREDDQWLWCGD